MLCNHRTEHHSILCCNKTTVIDQKSYLINLVIGLCLLIKQQAKKNNYQTDDAKNFSQQLGDYILTQHRAPKSHDILLFVCLQNNIKQCCEAKI